MRARAGESVREQEEAPKREDQREREEVVRRESKVEEKKKRERVRDSEREREHLRKLIKGKGDALTAHRQTHIKTQTNHRTSMRSINESCIHL